MVDKSREVKPSNLQENSFIIMARKNKVVKNSFKYYYNKNHFEFEFIILDSWFFIPNLSYLMNSILNFYLKIFLQNFTLKNDINFKSIFKY